MENLYKIENLQDAYNHLLFVNSGVTELFLLTTGISFINTNGNWDDVVVGDTVSYDPIKKIMLKVQ
jgi:hypothetical protein